MTDKAKLTKEQAKAIEWFLEEHGNDKEYLIDWFATSGINKNSVLNEQYKPFSDLKHSTLAKALYIGY